MPASTEKAKLPTWHAPPQPQPQKKKKNAPDRPQPAWLFPPDEENPVLNPKPKSEEKIQKETVEREKAIDYMKRRIHGAPDRPAPPPELLTLVGAFLAEYGFKSTGRLYTNERNARKVLNGWDDDIGVKLAKGTPSLEKIYRDWHKGTVAELNNDTSSSGSDSGSSSGSDSDSDAESSSSDSDSDSDVEMKDASQPKNTKTKALKKPKSPSPSSSSSSDSDADDEDEKPVKSDKVKKQAKQVSAAPTVSGMINKLKRKAESSSSDSSSSDSESEPEHEKPQTKKPKTSEVIISKAASLPSSKPSESSSDSQSSESSSASEESDTGEEEGVKAIAAKPPATSDDNDSDSSSASSSSSSDSENSSESEAELDEVKIAAAVPLPGSDESSTSSTTVQGDSKKVSASSASDPNSSATSSDDSSDSSDEEVSKTLPVAKTAKAAKVTKNITPKEKKPHKGAQPTPLAALSAGAQKEEYLSNDYVSYDYADRAYKDLSVTRGKGFTKEKNKKKRGSYRGGTIDTGPGKGFKFED